MQLFTENMEELNSYKDTHISNANLNNKLNLLEIMFDDYYNQGDQ